MGLEDNHLICIWDWKKGRLLTSANGHSDRVGILDMLTKGVFTQCDKNNNMQQNRAVLHAIAGKLNYFNFPATVARHTNKPVYTVQFCRMFFCHIV